MTQEHEQRSDSVVDILQRRLGTRHHSGMESGRKDIERVLMDELSMEHDQAHEMVSRMIDSGQIRYVTGDERDIEVDRDAQLDEHTDRAYQVGADRRGMADDVVTPGMIPPATAAGTAGMNTGTGMPPVPIAPPPSGGSPAVAPLFPAAGDADMAGDRMGYWDICGDKAGVVPSRSRKGQVEPRGT